MRPVLGQHRLEERRALRAAAGRGQHLGEADRDVPGLVRARGALDHRLQRGDRRLGPAFREVEPGERAGVGARVRGRRLPRLELGAGRVSPAHLEQELRQGQRRAGALRGGGAQHRLGAVGVAGVQVPLHQRRAYVGVLRKEPVHLGELGADGGVLAPLLEQRQAGEMQSLLGGHRREPGVDAGERAGEILRRQPVGDEHEMGEHVRGCLGEHALCHGHRRRPVGALAEVDGGLERAGRRILRVEGVGAGGMHLGGVEVLHLEREGCELAVAFGEARGELDELQVLGDRVARLAAVGEQRGIAQPGAPVLGVEPEDVAELHRRPVGIARLEIG